MLYRCLFIGSLMTIWSFFAQPLFAQSVKTIRKHLQEKEFDKAKEKINKLLTKDTFQLAALYLNTQYFLDSANRQFRIDSAYQQTKVLIYRHKKLTNIDKRHIEATEELKELDITASDFDDQKHNIETKIFYYTERKDNTVYGWQLFMQRYADSKLYAQAESNRNELAFILAKKENTYQSYKLFIDKYPQAKQVSEAKTQYEKLWYETETKDGKLSSYEKFIRNNPTTRYKTEIEEKIYKLSITDFGIDVYKNFILKYPDNYQKTKAWAWIWHLTEDKNTFLKQFPDFPAKDFAKQYVKYLNIPLYSVLEKGKISMIDVQGNILVNTPFEMIGEEDRCKVLEKDMIVGGANGDKAGAADRLGNLVVPFEYDYLEYVGKGIFIAEQNKKQGLYFAGLPSSATELQNATPNITGQLVLPCEYEELEAVAENQLIKYKKGNFYGLFFYNGIKLLEAEYDKIERFRGDTLLIIKGKDKGFFSPEKLHEIFKEWKAKNSNSTKQAEKITLKLPFESYELSHKVFIKLKYGESFGMADLEGKEIIKADKKQIKEIPKGWLVQNHDDSWHIIPFQITENLNNPLTEEGKWQQIITQEIIESYVPRIYGFTIKQNLKFGAADGFGNIFINPEYDKLEWVAENILIGTQGKKTFWIGINPAMTVNKITEQDLKKVEIPNRKDLTFKLFVKKGGNSNANFTTYIVAQNNKTKKQGLYNYEGKLVLPIKYDNLLPTENQLFIFTQGKLKGIINADGKTVLQPKYQQIKFIAPFGYTLENKKKFGVYHSRKKFLYDVKSTEPLKLYGDSALVIIAQKAKNFTINDLANKPLMTEQFTKVEFWTDSIALVRTQQNMWKLYDVIKRKFLGESFDDYKLLMQTPKEKVYLVYHGKKFGLLSNQRGNLIPEDYSFIKNLGTAENPFFFVEVYVSQAELHVVLYMDKDGNVVRKQTIPHSEYEKVMCEE